MTIEEKLELLNETIRQLSGDDRFRVFVEKLREMREDSIAVALHDETCGNSLKVAAALGEVRAYQDILNLIDEYKPIPVE